MGTQLLRPIPKSELKERTTASSLPLNCTVTVKAVIMDGIGKNGPWLLLDAAVESKGTEQGAFFLGVSKENSNIFKADNKGNLTHLVSDKFTRAKNVWTVN